MEEHGKLEHNYVTPGDGGNSSGLGGKQRDDYPDLIAFGGGNLLAIFHRNASLRQQQSPQGAQVI